jgi:hypothetical protein
MVTYAELSKKDKKKFDNVWDKIEDIYEFNKNKSDEYIIKKMAKLKFKNKPFGKRKAAIFLSKLIKYDSEYCD